MKCIIKFFPEITIKSKSVRLYFIRILTNNINNILSSFGNICKVRYYWDYIEVVLINNDYQFCSLIIKELTYIPGINHILLVEEFLFKNMYDIFEKIFTLYRDKLIGKSFCVRVKRVGKHNFTSQDIERYLGAMIIQNIVNTSVKLRQSEITIYLEIKGDRCFLIKNRYEGLGGFPIGTQGGVLSLISGGFDSGISSYMLIRRGCKVYYCFCNIGGVEHELCVQKIAYYLWKKFASSHVVQFVCVDFSVIMNEIFQKIHSAYMGVILKRMMIRVASGIAHHLRLSALVTGEVLGQVSSQTLNNLGLINNVSDIMIFRPLIGYDKQTIISLSRKIGIEDFSHLIPEYCGVFSKNPIIKTSEEAIKFEEKKFNFSVLNIAIVNSRIIDINQVASKINIRIDEVQFVHEPNDKDIIIDVRTQEEESVNPLKLIDKIIEIRKIPFYKLSSLLSTLDKNKTYLLYCERGIISRCQALYLKSQGFHNIFVYLP